MIYISFENCKILSENETCACDSIVSSNKGKGRLSSFTYNALGQVTSKVTVIGAKTYTTSFTYSLNGKLTQITYPSGRIVIVARNVVGQAPSRAAPE